MSLINDALKRAGQKPASSPSASEVAASLQPAEERPAAFPVLTLLIVLIPLVALGFWLLAKGVQLTGQPKPMPAETVVARAPDVPRTPAPVAAAATALPTNPPAATSQHSYKLQGIYWRPSKPSAVRSISASRR